MVPTRSIPVQIHHSTYLTGWPEDPELSPDSPGSYKHTHRATSNTAKDIRKVTLYTALTEKFSKETYIMQHAPTPARRRLNINVFKNAEALALIGGCVKMQLFIVDVDCHAPKGLEESEEERFERARGWFADEQEKIERLQEAHPGIICWQSKNGYRLLGLLRDPIELRSKEDLEGKWKHNYRAWLAYLKGEFQMFSEGKETGDKLDDFCRHQRVPHDTHRSPLQQGLHQVLGDVENVGYWEPELKAHYFPAPKEQKQFSGGKGDQQGCLLLRLIQNRGLRCEPVGGSAGHFDIECPDSYRHSAMNGKKDYFSKTRLLSDSSIGSILCMSSGCNDKQHTPLAWLDSFNEEEIEKAEQDLGRDKINCGPAQAVFLADLPRDLPPRVRKIITDGLNAEVLIKFGYSRDPAKDRGKKHSQWVFEIMCGCLREGMSFEKILGLFTHPLAQESVQLTLPGAGKYDKEFEADIDTEFATSGSNYLHTLGLTRRYLKFLLSLADESSRLPDSPEVLPTEKRSAYNMWRIKNYKSDTPENLKLFLTLHTDEF
jgi:hypothetical protein